MLFGGSGDGGEAAAQIGAQQRGQAEDPADERPNDPVSATSQWRVRSKWKAFIHSFNSFTIITLLSIDSKQVQYQLNYLNLRARAEPIRLMLHYVKQPFEERLEHFEKFAKHKDGSSERMPEFPLKIN